MWIIADLNQTEALPPVSKLSGVSIASLVQNKTNGVVKDFM